MRNSVLINQNFTEKNKMNFKNTFLALIIIIISLNLI